MFSRLNVIATVVASSSSGTFPFWRKPKPPAAKPKKPELAVQVPRKLGTKRAMKRKRSLKKEYTQGECCLFRLADRLYQQMPAAQREVWKSAIKAPHKSAYDLWMSEALYLMNQGKNPPDAPSLPGERP